MIKVYLEIGVKSIGVEEHVLSWPDNTDSHIIHNYIEILAREYLECMGMSGAYSTNEVINYTISQE